MPNDTSAMDDVLSELSAAFDRLQQENAQLRAERDEWRRIAGRLANAKKTNRRQRERNAEKHANGRAE